MTKVLIATQDTFTKAGRFVSKGNPLPADEVDYDAEKSVNLTEAPRSLQSGQQPVVEISAIAPTGPNPTAPQQIAPDVVQSATGYEQQGVRLVGEVTQPEKQRIKVVGIDDDKGRTAQADVNEQLEKAAEEQRQLEADQRAAAADAEGGEQPKSRKKS